MSDHHATRFLFEAFHLNGDDTVRVARDAIWIAVVGVPVLYVGLRLYVGRRRRRYLFR